MRKTRSQTQAENALLSGGAKSSSRSGTVSSSTTANHQQTQQHQMTPGNPQKGSTQAPANLNYVNPSILKECEEMVSVLRVVELQKILSYLNINFAGRKVDYQRRILGFLRTNFDLVAPKVREVYALSIVEQQANQYGPPDPKRMYSQMQMQPNAAGMVGANAAAQMGTAQQILNPASQAGMQGGGPPVNAVVPFLHAIPTQMPIHPDVRLKKLAFYDVLGTLIKPSSLVPRNAQRIQEVPFYFTLTPQQATEIASNRDIRNSSKIEHAIQVQLRFCLLETSCDQEDCFPPSVVVKVNNKLCQLPNVIPTNRPNVEPKRPPRPVNVTSNVKLSPTVTNTITVQWCPDYTRGYCIAVYLVKKLTSAQLLQRMKQKGVKPADYTRALIKEKLTEDADCEIATTMLKVSLNCPLGKMKMSIPCRASTCSHLQCFDASLYLQMNERKPTWNCPVCDKPAVYDHLVIDGYFQEVLASNLLKSDDTEIQLHKDGSWSTHSLRNEGQIIDTPTKPVEKVEVISDDIELITTEDVKPVKAAASASVNNTNEQPSSTTNSETVDLTLSDSDDDLPLAKRRPAAKQNANQGQPSSTVNGNGGAGNQRGGMYMQQKNVVKYATNKSKELTNLPINSNNDDEIISLDSPSPPGSPVPLSDKDLQIEKKASLTSSRAICVYPPENDTTIIHEPGFLSYPIKIEELSSDYDIYGENLNCDEITSPFCTILNDEAFDSNNLNITEFSSLDTISFNSADLVSEDDGDDNGNDDAMLGESSNFKEIVALIESLSDEETTLSESYNQNISSPIETTTETRESLNNIEDILPLTTEANCNDLIIAKKANNGGLSALAKTVQCEPNASKSSNENILPSLNKTTNCNMNDNERANSSKDFSVTKNFSLNTNTALRYRPAKALTHKDTNNRENLNWRTLRICRPGKTLTHKDKNIRKNINIRKDLFFPSSTRRNDNTNASMNFNFNKTPLPSDSATNDIAGTSEDTNLRELTITIDNSSNDEINSGENKLYSFLYTIANEGLVCQAVLSPSETTTNAEGILSESLNHNKDNLASKSILSLAPQSQENLSLNDNSMALETNIKDIPEATLNAPKSNDNGSVTLLDDLCTSIQKQNENFNCREVMLPPETTTNEQADFAKNSNCNKESFNSDLLFNYDDSISLEMAKTDERNTTPPETTANSNDKNIIKKNSKRKEIAALLNAALLSIDETSSRQTSSLNNKEITTFSSKQSDSSLTNNERIRGNNSSSNNTTGRAIITKASNASLKSCEVSSSLVTSRQGETIPARCINSNEVTSSLDAPTHVSESSNIEETTNNYEEIANSEVTSSPTVMVSDTEITTTYDSSENANDQITEKILPTSSNLKSPSVLKNSSLAAKPTDNLISNESLSSSEFITAINETLAQEPEQSSLNLDMTQVQIPCSSNKMKQHFCIFCKKLQTKIARHLLLKHKNEKQIQAILKLPNKHQKRLEVLDLLRKEGDFLHNTNKSLNTGVLIVTRQQQAKRKNKADNYVCCKNCKGFFSKSSIRLHTVRCGYFKKNRLICRRPTLYIHGVASDKLKTKIFPALRGEGIIKIIRYDELIINYGNKLAEKYAKNDIVQSQLILLGRFKASLQNLCPGLHELKQIFEPLKINFCLEAYCKLANWDSCLKRFANPSIAHDLSLMINKCGRLQRLELNNIQNPKLLTDLNEFLIMWNEEVSKLINKNNSKELDETNKQEEKSRNDEVHNNVENSNTPDLSKPNAAEETYEQILDNWTNLEDSNAIDILFADILDNTSEKQLEESNTEKDLHFKGLQNVNEKSKTEEEGIVTELSQEVSVQRYQENTMNKTNVIDSNELKTIDETSASKVDQNNIEDELISDEVSDTEIDPDYIQEDFSSDDSIRYDEDINKDISIKKLNKTLSPKCAKTREKKLLNLDITNSSMLQDREKNDTHLDIRKVHIPCASNKNKRHFCVFCKTLQTRLSRHLILMHKSEKPIQAILKLPKKHKERMKVFDQLRKEGDFLHNTTKSFNTGVLIVSRQQQARMKHNADDYVCCKNCKGFFSHRTFRLHTATCKNFKKDEQNNIIASRRLTQYIHGSASDKLKTVIFPLLRMDDVTKIIRYDELIIKYGNEMANKYTQDQQYDTLRARLRLLGRFKIEVQKLQPEIEELYQVFKPKIFQNCLRAFCKIANWDSDLKCFRTSTIAQNLYMLIKKCINIQKTEWKKKHNGKLTKNLDKFLIMWEKKIRKLFYKEALKDLAKRNKDVAGGTREIEDGTKNLEKEQKSSHSFTSDELSESESDIFSDTSDDYSSHTTDENVSCKETASTENLNHNGDKTSSNFDITKVLIPYSSTTRITRKHFCIYCKTLRTKLPRHFFTQHRSEAQIKAILKLPKKHPQRLKVLSQLRKEGDFLHNTSKSLNTGMLIVSRLQLKNMKNNADDYACCKFCKGFFSRRTLRMHLRRCGTCKNNERENLIASRRLTQYLHEAASEKLKSEIFPPLRLDVITKIIRYDELIIKYGNEVGEKYAPEIVRSQLRLLGRFKIAFKDLQPDIEELQQALKPQEFNNCLKAFCKATGWNNDLKYFRTQSVAQNLYVIIRKCANIIKKESETTGNDDLTKNVEEFLALWTKDIRKLISKESSEDVKSTKENVKRKTKSYCDSIGSNKKFEENIIDKDFNSIETNNSDLSDTNKMEIAEQENKEKGVNCNATEERLDKEDDKIDYGKDSYPNISDSKRKRVTKNIVKTTNYQDLNESISSSDEISDSKKDPDYIDDNSSLTSEEDFSNLAHEEVVDPQTTNDKTNVEKTSSNLELSQVAIPHSGMARKYFCIFCKQLQTKLPRHFFTKHRSEAQIKAILKFPKKHEERLRLLNQLRKEGAFLHNTTQSLNTGMLIVSRQQQKNMSKKADDYACCKFCKGFFSKSTIKKHIRQCDINEYKKNDRTNLIASRCLTQYLHKTANKKLRMEIFPVLKLDNITKAIRYDELIIKYGNKFVEKCTNVKLYDQLRNHLRLLGRFKIAVKNLSPEVEEFKDIFKLEMFNDCRKAFLNVANWDKDLKWFKTFSTAQMLSSVIKKCGQLLRAEFKQSQQLELKNALDDFLLKWEEEMAKLVNKRSNEDLEDLENEENAGADTGENSKKKLNADDAEDNTHEIAQKNDEDAKESAAKISNVADGSSKTDENKLDTNFNNDEVSFSDKSDESYHCDEMTPSKRKRTQKEKSPLRFTKIKRIRWTQEEQDVIISKFGCPNEIEKLPSLKECIDLINKFPILKRRTPPQIKSWIDNQRSKKVISKIARKETEQDTNSDSMDESRIIKEITKRKTISPSNLPKLKRIRWSQEEQDAIISNFGCLKSLNRLPSLMECTDLINKVPILMTRTAPQLKSWIDNQRRYK